MPLRIVNDDIAKIRRDAIVSTTNTRLQPVSSVGFSTANISPAITQSSRKLGRSMAKEGEAIISPAIDLKCNYVIHTVLPESDKVSEASVRSCYRNALAAAAKNKFTSVAIPFISPSSTSSSKGKLWRVATDTIRDFLSDNEMMIYLAIPSKELCKPADKVLSSVEKYLRRVESDQDDRNREVQRAANFSVASASVTPSSMRFGESDGVAGINVSKFSVNLGALPLDSMLKNLDKGFRDTLFYYIDKKGVSDVECYKRSNVDKKTFSKIRSNADYRPSKVTAVSFAVGLHLDMTETEHLLSTAGMCLSHSNKFDVIIEYFITSGGYDTIFDVNEVLYKFDQSLLGV